MKKNITEITKQIQELSKVINSFKSEAVQLKLIDVLLKDLPLEAEVKEKVKAAKPQVKAKKESAKKVAVKSNVKKPVAKAVAKKEQAKVEKPAKAEVAKKVSTKPAKVVKKKVAKAVKPAKVAKAAKAVKPAKAVKKAKPAKKQRTVRTKKYNQGPSGIIKQMFEAGYFNTKKSMADVVKHFNDELKLPYKITDISGIVNKYVLDKKLSREKNPTNHKFEYFKA